MSRPAGRGSPLAWPTSQGGCALAAPVYCRVMASTGLLVCVSRHLLPLLLSRTERQHTQRKALRVVVVAMVAGRLANGFNELGRRRRRLCQRNKAPVVGPASSLARSLSSRHGTDHCDSFVFGCCCRRGGHTNAVNSAFGAATPQHSRGRPLVSALRPSATDLATRLRPNCERLTRPEFRGDGIGPLDAARVSSWA